MALGVVAVEDYAVDGDGDGFDDDFDDAADECPGLNTANELIVNILGVDVTAFIINTRPAPNILIPGIASRSLQHTSGNGPHDDTQDEEANSKDGVVNGCLFRSAMPAAVVRPEDHDAESEGDTGAGENDVLGPCLRRLGPGREIGFLCDVAGGEEYVQRCGDESEDDEGAGEVDGAEEHLDYADASLDFQVLCLLFFGHLFLLLQLVLLHECRTERVLKPPSWSARNLHRTLQSRRCWTDLNLDMSWCGVLRDVAKANICWF